MSEPTIRLHREAREALARGIRTLDDAVGVTVGPRGRSAVVGRPSGPPLVTTDGARVAAAVHLSDPHAALGARLLREAAGRTRAAAGGGTSVTVVLARALVDGLLERLEDAGDAVELERGLAAGVRAATAALRAGSEPLETPDAVRSVATTAALGDTGIGEVVAEALSRLGKDAPMVVLESDGPETFLEPSQGLRLAGTRLHPAPSGGEDDVLELRSPLVLLSGVAVADRDDLVRLLEQAARAGRPLVLVVPEIEAEALELVRGAHDRGTLQAAVVRTSTRGDHAIRILRDLAVLTRGSLLHTSTGLALESATLSEAGRAETALVGPAATTFLTADAGRDVAVRIQQIRRQIEEAPEGTDTSAFRSRVAALAGGVAVVRIGGRDVEEVARRRDRAEGAIQATRVALAEGVVPGAGTALLRAADAVDASSADTPGMAAAMEVVRAALSAPLRRIADNAGADGEQVVARVAGGQGAYGFDARTRTFGDLVQLELLDPALLLRRALEEAAACARTVLTTGVLLDPPRDPSPTP